jgi:hypothetical protein
VQQEAPEEFVDVNRQGAPLTPVPIVLPPKRDGVVGDGDESVIRDGDAVSVPREVVQDVGGAPKEWLRLDHPRLVMKRQEVVDDALIRQRETPQRFWHREDDVHVAHRQELLLPRGHPGVAGGREALGTMPIPTAVVREGRLRTLVAAIAMPTECRRSTLGDGLEDAPKLGGHPGAVGLPKTIAVLAHDVGHLERWANFESN